MKIEKFNSTIDIWLTELNKFNITQLLIRPTEKSWSLGQLYEHILEETNWYNCQMELSLKDEENANSPTTKEAKTLFEAGSFADKRFQGDPLISENVKQPKSIEKLRAGFTELKNETNAIGEKMNTAITYGKSEHPGLGFLDCFQWLQYSEMHMRHHLRQKKRIEEFLNKNKL